MREFDRLSTVLVEQKKTDNEEAWWRTAVQVAYLENTVKGMLVKGYRTKSPKEYFDAWIQPEAVHNERIARIRRARERHHARLEREKKKRNGL